jgi:ubiquinone/menaquinone biosynthesis C-methylase UbiE
VCSSSVDRLAAAASQAVGIVAAIDGYKARITAELRAYNEVEEVHDLPLIHSYWAERFVLPLFSEMGAASIDDLWEQHIAEQCMRRAPQPARLVSLGAGNGELELPLAARLAERGLTNLEIVLLELNPAMIERALEVAQELGLGDRVRAEQTDLNTWTADRGADVYLAVHSLHHVVELEHLYGEIARSIDPQGVLLVNDMIGRNGHVRWPEAGAIVHRIWRDAPESYRYNHFAKHIDVAYPDIDCSGEGFEGIRSQDVLPLLLERFHPEVYVTFGNVIDPFIDRVYGPNFDMRNPADTSFIDAVARLDEAAIDLGVLTPTHLVASFRRRPVKCRYPRERSPERTVRKPDRTADVDPVVLEAQVRTTAARYQALRSRKAVRMALALAALQDQARGFVRRRRDRR